MEVRGLRKDGIHLFNIRYWSERLPLIARPDDDLVVRYDPRNLARIYVLGRDVAYHDIVYADVRHPPFSRGFLSGHSVHLGNDSRYRALYGACRDEQTHANRHGDANPNPDWVRTPHSM
jgi:hypothetical protein